MVTCADSEGDIGSAPPPGKSKVLWVSRISIGPPAPPPRNRLDIPPPPSKPCKIIVFFEINHQKEKTKTVVRAVFWKSGLDHPGKNSWIRAWVSQHPNSDSGHYRPASKMSFGWRFSGGPIMARLYVLTGCRSVLNPTCIYSSILAMFFSGVRFVSVNVQFYINLLSTPPPPIFLKT